MRHSIRILILTAGALALAGLLWSGPAAAQQSTVTTFSGTTTGTGKITRTIIDVQPTRAREAKVTSTLTVTCTLPGSGFSSGSVGRAFRDSCNVQVGGFGYSAYFNRLADSTQVVLHKSSGHFNASDGNTIPGVSMASYIVPALSPLGLCMVLAGLAALALWGLRRVRRA